MKQLLRKQPISSTIALHEKTKKVKQLNGIKEVVRGNGKIYYKEYPRFPRIALPFITNQEKKDFFQVLLERQSTQNSKKLSLNLQTISELLFFSAGINRIDKKTHIIKRVYPSYGLAYPLEVYIGMPHKIKELQEGIYHYNVKFHALEYIKKDVFFDEIAKGMSEINKKLLEKSSLVFIITAVFGRAELHFGKRAYRYTLIEAGCLAQNLSLVSTVLNTSGTIIGEFHDDTMQSLLDVDTDKEQAIFLFAVGK